MDKLDHYRDILSDLMTTYSSYQSSRDAVVMSPLIDRVNDHYGLIMSGWDGDRRVQGFVIHLDIIDGKIWLQYDGTDLNVALDLVEAGVPREDIVLGFHPPEVRPHTGFATG